MLSDLARRKSACLHPLGCNGHDQAGKSRYRAQARVVDEATREGRFRMFRVLRKPESLTADVSG